MITEPTVVTTLRSKEELLADSQVCEECKRFKAWGFSIDQDFPNSLRADEYTEYKAGLTEHERITGHTVPSSY